MRKKFDNETPKPCHDYHLNQCKRSNCKYLHEGVPQGKCILGNNCFLCKGKKEEVKFESSISTSKNNNNFQIKQCHDYHLTGTCQFKNCRFSHEGIPLLKCILGENCSYCVHKKKNFVSDSRCHDYHLNYCNKVNCKFSHEGVPEKKCIYSGQAADCPWCQKQILKECHAFHLNKCNKPNCPRKHTGVSQNKCIYGIMCFKCNNACHQFQVKGKCARYKCKFDHIQPATMTCPFGRDSCIFCNFRRVKRKKCHYIQKFGKCDIKNCKFSHKDVKFTKECTNFWCQACLKESGQINNQFSQKIQDQVQKINQQIDDCEISPDSLKAAEQVIDDRLICNLPPLIPEEAKSNKNYYQGSEVSFFPYNYNSNNPQEILTSCRQILKRFLGFNYVITNDIVQVTAQGQGKLISINGELINIDIKNNQLKINNNQQIQMCDQIYAVNVILREDSYYQNHVQKKNQQQQARLEEQTILVALQPLNQPIIGQFVLETGQQNQKQQQKANNLYDPYKIDQLQKILEKNIKRLQQLRKQSMTKQLQLNKCSIEVAFVLDTTSSMQPYIDESKNTIIQIIKEIERKVPKTRFEIQYGIVAYRDHPPQDTTYVTKFQDFKPSVQEAITYIQSLDAKGGGDAPEALFDGIYQASQLSWSQEDQSYGGCQRIIIHITDAPPHGKQYSKYDSEWKDGCPCKIDVHKISQQLNQQEISYNLLAIGESLDKTVKIFSRYFQQFDYRDIKHNERNQQTKLILQMLEKFPWWQLASE